ncbi:MAG TPA: nuclear transport factor 2 family protein [Acidimicrobiales bacterium]
MTDDELAQLLAVACAAEDEPADPDERVQRLEDRRRIVELLIEYGLREDASRWDELLDLCTDDVERVLAGSLDERVTGKEALRAVLLAPVMPRKSGVGAAPPPEQVLAYEVRHLIDQPVVRVHGDTATVVASYSLLATTGDGATFRRGRHEGGYVFELRRGGPRGWLISRMLIITENARNPLFNREAS